MDGRTVQFKVEEGEKGVDNRSVDLHKQRECFVNDIRRSSLHDRLVEVQRSGGLETTLVRDFSAEGMKVSLRVNEVVSTSFFARQFGSDR